MSFDLPLVWESLPRLSEGLGLTLMLLLCSLSIGLLLAAPATFALLRGGRLLREVARAYVWMFRGTPALVQLFVIYYGLAQFAWLRETPVWVLLREPFWCCVIAFSLNSGAYTAEILRGAISGIPAGQIEAARSLSLRPVTTFFRVVWPQALRLALPPYGNEVIGMLKTTALASTVTMAEITGVAETIVAETFAPYEVFLSAALIYLILVWIFERVLAVAERVLRTP